MPSSPKFFCPRNASSSPSSYTRRTLFLIFCLLLGISGFLFGSIAIWRSDSGSNCRNFKPNSVSVVWEKTSVGDLDSTESSGDQKKRHKVMGFVGIFTGFGSGGRRKSLRKTWMPSDRQALHRLEESTGLAIRFVIGKTSDRSKMSDLRKEVAEYDDFVLLDMEEHYSKLPYKTFVISIIFYRIPVLFMFVSKELIWFSFCRLAFFKAANALFDSDFYVKADDDIYLRPDRLSLLLAKERSHTRTYLGCMKKGPVFTDPKLKWYEPLSYLLGREYFLHAYGPIYALSAEVVASLVALRNNSFRMFSNEDVTIGSWMLAMNVNHENNQALCAPDCIPSSIAVWDIPTCSGLCNPEKKLLELHQKDSCAKSPTLESGE